MPALCLSHLHDLGCWVGGGRDHRGWGWGSSHVLRLCCNHIGLGGNNVLQTAIRRQQWGCWWTCWWTYSGAAEPTMLRMTHLRLSSNNVLRSCSNCVGGSHNLQQQKSRQLKGKTGVLIDGSLESRPQHCPLDVCPGKLGRVINKPAGLTGAGAAAPLPLPLPQNRQSAPVRPRDAEAPHTAVSQGGQLVKECTWRCLPASLAVCYD